MTEQHHEHHRADEEFSPSQGKSLRKVHDRKPAMNIIAGRQPVTEALKGGTLIEKIVILFGVKGPPIEKIKQLRKMIDERGLNVHIEIDGGVTLENAPAIIAAGADVLVAGNTVFKSTDPKATISKLKKL